MLIRQRFKDTKKVVSIRFDQINDLSPAIHLHSSPAKTPLYDMMSEAPMLPPEIQLEILNSAINQIMRSSIKVRRYFDEPTARAHASRSAQQILNLRLISTLADREVISICWKKFEKIILIDPWHRTDSWEMHIEELILGHCLRGWLLEAPNVSDDPLLRRARQMVHEHESMSDSLRIRERSSRQPQLEEEEDPEIPDMATLIATALGKSTGLNTMQHANAPKKRPLANATKSPRNTRRRQNPSRNALREQLGIKEYHHRRLLKAYPGISYAELAARLKRAVHDDRMAEIDREEIEALAWERALKMCDQLVYGLE